MTAAAISAHDPYPRHHLPVLDSQIAYVDTGAGDPVVFLHGNPTFSYVWRNVLPHLRENFRCLAPDLIGMGDSGKNPSGSYRFADHARYLDAWFAGLDFQEKVTLVLHDWGSALGFHWANRHQEQVKALVYMEAIVQPITWDDWPLTARQIFMAMRSPAGEEIILDKNIFVERILPGSCMRELTAEEMAAYSRPYLEAGESRRPTLTWPRQIPIDGQPADVAEIVAAYGAWLQRSNLPKLFINAEPGAILTGRQREFCRSWANQQEVTIEGIHFVQEDAPHEIGQATRDFLDGLNSSDP